MTQAVISGVKLSGISCAVPAAVITPEDSGELFGVEEVKKIVKNTGVHQRHVVSRGMCASDLCVSSAKCLLEGLGWDRKEIEVLINVTQTPDYLLPATACTIQTRLSLSQNCAAFDVNLGCSGYVYGLWVISNLMKCSKIKKGLMLAGDTISRICNPRDRSTAPLFGDAGTATAVELDDRAEEMVFVLGTDGLGEDKLIVPGGGFRNPFGIKNHGVSARDEGERSDRELFMDGAEIFTFTLKCVPKLVEDILGRANWSMDDIDYFVFHQANKFILDHLRKKLKIPEEKFITAIGSYGNTSCASIPLAMNAVLKEKLVAERKRLVLAGFGVGYSWAGIALSCGPLFISDIISCE
ncbi:MAG: ketoacyl-ACP synthase III [Pseudomonadota bacterium]